MMSTKVCILCDDLVPGWHDTPGGPVCNHCMEGIDCPHCKRHKGLREQLSAALCIERHKAKEKEAEAAAVIAQQNEAIARMAIYIASNVVAQEAGND